MARKTISELTGLFEDGDTPEGADFASIFDSNFNLQETGTSVASGSLTLLGGQTISGSLKVSGSILPDGSGSHDLGSEANPWGEIYVVSSSINFMSNDGRKLATISVDEDGKLETTPSGSATPDPIASFPFNGDAVITGSLTISGSFNAFRVDSDDIVLGLNAGASMEAGATTRNVLIGENAGDSITTSPYNIAIGYNTLSTATAGANGNVTIGYKAGQAISTGDRNVGIGDEAGSKITTGGTNIAIGLISMGGSNNKTGADNIGIGQYTGEKLSSGASNIMIGRQAGNSLTTGDYNILIGDDVDASSAGADNELKIGKGAVVPISASLDTGDVLFPSTASAAYFSGDGSQLTNLPGGGIFSDSGNYKQTINNLIISSSNSTSSLSIIGSGSTVFDIEGSVGTLFSAVDSLSGSLMAVTDASGIPILEVFSDATVEAKGFKGYRPIETRAASFVLQLGDMGTYNRCGGAMTASLSASSAIPFEIGTEIEFFQTSSAGNLLITASAGSGITLNSKDGNLKLAGQFSAATLKKVGTDEWDLVGDLTS